MDIDEIDVCVLLPSDLEKFAKLITEHATECVRDVLREEDSPLTYEATDMIQKRIKQYFGVK